MKRMQAPTPNNFLTHVLTLPQAFSPQECRQLIALSKAASTGHAAQIGTSNEQQLDTQIRRTTLYPLPPNAASQWFFERLHAMVQSANQQFYRFELSHLSEVNVLEYPLHGFYSWHRDLGQGSTCFRKLSLIVFLSQPGQDFAGGELCFEDAEVHDQQQGTLAIFPSFMLHTVKPVTQGQRYSLVAWVNGPCFR